MPTIFFNPFKNIKVNQTPPAEQNRLPAENSHEIVKNEAPAQTRFSQKPEGSEGLPKKRFGRLKDWFGRIKARRSEQKGIKKTRQDFEKHYGRFAENLKQELRDDQIEQKYQKAEKLSMQDNITKPDRKAMFKLYQDVAAQGHAPSQQRLAEIYQHGGKGIEQNIKRSAFWYAKAAKQGNALAQNNLGEMHSHVKGMKDYVKAKDYFTQAAKQGYTPAQNNLGVIYHEGQGVPKDDKQAIFWFEKAAAQGNAPAQNNLQILKRKLA